MQRIGIVGLGIMGSGMANNFLKKGHKVFVWNRTKSVIENLVKNGAIACESPSEVSRQADLTFEVTANDESSRKVWLGKNGIFAGADDSKILVASATLSIEWIEELIKISRQKNLKFMDIALTGGRIGAETGNLTLLAGGEEETLRIISQSLQSIANKVLYFGPVGHGMKYKLILNFLQAIHMIGFGQAMKIAQDQKMDLQKVAQALADRPGGVVTNIAKNAFFTKPNPATFSIKWIAKDLSYAKKFTKDLDLGLLNEVLAEYQEALDNGFGTEDWASINVLEEPVLMIY